MIKFFVLYRLLLKGMAGKYVVLSVNRIWKSKIFCKKGKTFYTVYPPISVSCVIEGYKWYFITTFTEKVDTKRQIFSFTYLYRTNCRLWGNLQTEIVCRDSGCLQIIFMKNDIFSSPAERFGFKTRDGYKIFLGVQ